MRQLRREVSHCNVFLADMENQHAEDPSTLVSTLLRLRGGGTSVRSEELNEYRTNEDGKRKSRWKGRTQLNSPTSDLAVLCLDSRLGVLGGPLGGRDGGRDGGFR